MVDTVGVDVGTRRFVPDWLTLKGECPLPGARTGARGI